MSVSYEPKVIQKFADKLYDRANSIVVLYGFLGLSLGVLGGLLIPGVDPTIPAIVVCLLGIAVGVSKSAELRLKAQEALCQMHIEWNTRSLRKKDEQKAKAQIETCEASQG